MKIFIASLLCIFSVEAYHVQTLLPIQQTLFEISTPVGEAIVFRPNLEELRSTASIAKSIFIEAFTTTYTEYHQQSGSTDPIEKWLSLQPGLTLQSWLSDVFDEEVEDYEVGKKVFIYLCDSNGTLLGWLSHTPISSSGELYLSQCSLEAGSRNQRVATMLFETTFQGDLIKQLFPGVTEIKLITRKINTIAKHLYLKAGFTMDETIDPCVYGESYDDRYIAFKLHLGESNS